MEGSNIPLSKWALTAYLMTTSLKGVSSMKLHRDLGVTQTAWFLAHRIRKAWEDNDGLFSGPIEVDETYVGVNTLVALGTTEPGAPAGRELGPPLG